MKPSYGVGIVAVALAFSGAAFASISKDEYKAGKDRIAADYKGAKASCGALSGNAKDICMAEAKGREKVAKAQLEADYKPTVKNRYDVAVAKAEADYSVAKEKCDDRTGNDKDVCKKEAKAAEVKAKADAKVAHVSTDATHTASAKRTEARKDAMEDKRDAEYKVAVEKCDAMSGAAKSNCVQEAKARFGRS